MEELTIDQLQQLLEYFQENAGCIQPLNGIELPKFSGDNVLNWIYTCESIFIKNPMHERHKFQLIEVSLEDRASIWHQTLDLKSTKHALTSWNAYMEALYWRFGIGDLEPIYELKKMKLQLSREDYIKYLEWQVSSVKKAKITLTHDDIEILYNGSASVSYITPEHQSLEISLAINEFSKEDDEEAYHEKNGISRNQFTSSNTEISSSHALMPGNQLEMGMKFSQEELLALDPKASAQHNFHNASKDEMEFGKQHMSSFQEEHPCNMENKVISVPNIGDNIKIHFNSDKIMDFDKSPIEVCKDLIQEGVGNVLVFASKKPIINEIETLLIHKCFKDVILYDEEPGGFDMQSPKSVTINIHEMDVMDIVECNYVGNNLPKTLAQNSVDGVLLHVGRHSGTMWEDQNIKVFMSIQDLHYDADVFACRASIAKCQGAEFVFIDVSMGNISLLLKCGDEAKVVDCKCIQQEVYKILVKMFFIIWSWYYKEIEFFSTKEMDFIHPGNWIKEWKVAWVKSKLPSINHRWSRDIICQAAHFCVEVSYHVAYECKTQQDGSDVLKSLRTMIFQRGKNCYDPKFSNITNFQQQASESFMRNYVDFLRLRKMSSSPTRMPRLQHFEPKGPTVPSCTQIMHSESQQTVPQIIGTSVPQAQVDPA